MMSSDSGVCDLAKDPIEGGTCVSGVILSWNMDKDSIHTNNGG